eukprot:14679460-Heterocapsa_arctica.AAC.1
MWGGRMPTADPASGRDVDPVIERAAQTRGQWLGNNEVDTVAQEGGAGVADNRRQEDHCLALRVPRSLAQVLERGLQEKSQGETG